MNDEDAYIRVGFNGACAVGVIAGTTAGELERSLEGAGLAYVWIRQSDGTTALSNDTVYTGMTARVNKTYYIKIAVYGDVDGDGTVTVSDVTAMSSLYGEVNNNEFACAADMDFNGTVSISDKYYLRDYISTYTCKAAFSSTHYTDSESTGVISDDEYISVGVPAVLAGQSPYPVSATHYDDRTPAEVLELMVNNEVFTIGAHGSQTGIVTGRNLTLADNTTGSLEDPNKGFTIDTVNTLADNALQNSRFIYYSSCLTGAGGETANNLVNATFNKGAKAVLGFKTEVLNNVNQAWNSAFYEAIYWYGASITEAMALADNSVEETSGSGSVMYYRLFQGDATQRLAHFKGISDFETTCSDMISLYGTSSTEEPSVIINNGFSESGRKEIDTDANEQGYVNISAINNAGLERSSEEKQSIALQAASEYIDPSDYTMREQYIDSTGMTHYVFVKQINGIDTSDYCGVMVAEDGSVFSVKAIDTGSFDNISLPEISIEAISDYVARESGSTVFDILELKYAYTETGSFVLNILYDSNESEIDIIQMPMAQ
ncbi:MAG: dockerin type I domain-containing protein [Candidatus Howiella sp.]